MRLWSLTVNLEGVMNKQGAAVAVRKCLSTTSVAIPSHQSGVPSYYVLRSRTIGWFGDFFTRGSLVLFSTLFFSAMIPWS